MIAGEAAEIYYECPGRGHCERINSSGKAMLQAAVRCRIQNQARPMPWAYGLGSAREVMMAVRSLIQGLIDKLGQGACSPDDLARAYGLLANPNTTDEERRALTAALSRARG